MKEGGAGRGKRKEKREEGGGRREMRGRGEQKSFDYENIHVFKLLGSRGTCAEFVYR